MAFIVKKRISGKEYFYLRGSKRVDGKVKAVTLAYLGKDAEQAKVKMAEYLAKEKQGKLSENGRDAGRNKEGEKEFDNVEIGVVRGASKGDVLAKKYNISIGISLGNKWFTRDNLRKYILWALKYTKDRVCIEIADTLHAINYEVRSKFTKEAAIRKALKEGDKFLGVCKEVISELSKEDRARIDIIRWDEIREDKEYKRNCYFFKNEFKRNRDFREDIKEIVRDFSRRLDSPLREEKIERLCYYVLDELPELLNGFTCKGIRYCCWLYPYDTKLHTLVEKIQRGEAYSEFHKNIEIGNNVFVELKVRESNKKEQIELKSMSKKEEEKEKDFTSFVQEAGLIWGPEPEIYGGLAGFYTYGPLGKLLKNKVENSVRKVFNANGFREMEGPSVMPDVVWKASGHLETFNDPLILTKDGKESFRADKLLEDVGIQPTSLDDGYLLDMIKKHNIKSPDGKELAMKIERYSLMMKTKVAGTDASLRPETATVTYLPFLRVLHYFRKKLPFGVYQIGKAYRNEISPRQSVLRGREFTQAEGQLFVDPLRKNEWEKFDEIKDEQLPIWSAKDQLNSSTTHPTKLNNKETAKSDSHDNNVKIMSVNDIVSEKFVKSKAYAWCLHLAYKQFVRFGVPKERIRLRQHGDDEKAFYADDAWDIELNLKHYGWTEVCGVHDRTDYDLKQHAKESGEKLEAIRENGERFVPHVLEIAFGTDRPTYALIDLFYEKKEEGEGKSMFKIPYSMAPIDVSVFALMKKPELLELSESVKEKLEKDFIVDYDVSGSIGKRYLRSAMAGTPFAVTVDYDSLEDESVTVRDRDSEKQIRVKISELSDKLRRLLSGEGKISS